MNKQLLAVIERALQTDKQVFPLNKSWKFLHQQYNIGRTQGDKLEVTPQDKQELLALAKLETGVDLGQVSVADFLAMNRDEALTYAVDEKLAGQAVKKDRLAIKALPGRALKINGGSFILPACGYQDMALADLATITHPGIWVIENYLCFDKLEKMRLSLPEQQADPLVLFRGDNYYSQHTVRQLLERFRLPVMVMPDLDPQGLMIAQSFPDAVGLIAPCLEDLETLFKDQQKANPKLYEKQSAGCRNALSASPHALIRRLWKMMETHQAGLVQEYWLQGDYELRVHAF